MTGSQEIKGAIFDLDGVILDSMSVWDTIGEQYLIAQKIFDEKLSVREVEKLVKDLHKPPKPPKEENKTLQAIYQEISERLKQSLSTKVSVSAKQNGAGKIEIEFYNHEDLERLLERITG